MTTTDRPLTGVRVIELGWFLPAPLTAQYLADLGAEVIKVEPPTGDPARRMDAELFWPANRNKQSLVLDLKKQWARRALGVLADTADVLIEGFRPGTAVSLGADPDALTARNPGLIYCSISGFGQTGPDRDRPGHDVNYLAASGALSFSAHVAEPPRRSGVPLADLLGAANATIAILAALRDRDRSGQGCHLDVSLTDAALAGASVRGGRDLRLTDDHRVSAYPTNDVFPTSDGQLLAVGIVEQHFWKRLVGVLRQYAPEVASSRFANHADRRDHAEELVGLLRHAFSRRTLSAWLHDLTQADLPVTPVRTLQEAADEVGAARGLVESRAGDRYVLFPVLKDGDPLGVMTTTPPQLGSHTSQVLSSLGIDSSNTSRGPATRSHRGL